MVQTVSSSRWRSLDCHGQEIECDGILSGGQRVDAGCHSKQIVIEFVLKKKFKIRFSLKSLFVCITGASIVLGSFCIHHSLRARHRKKLERSLIAFICNHYGPRSFAVVDSEIKAIDQAEDLNTENANKKLYVRFVENLKWEGWSTVELDYGSYSSYVEGSGEKGAKFRVEYGKWTQVNEGNSWISFRSDDPRICF